MAKYVKYIIIVLLIIVCIFLVWYVFVRENDEIEGYMNKFNNAVEVVQGVDKEPEVLPPINSELPDNSTELKPDNDKENEGTTSKPNTNGESSVILTSETEMLNKQGEELLKQISKELENSILTINQSTGVVDDDILNKEQDL